MNDDNSTSPDTTALRTALWRALHLEVDAPPPVFEDRIGLQLAAPEEGWRERPDMGAFTRPFRASIVARARFIEDLVEQESAAGIEQYVILGAGLDSFAQRRPELASRMQIYEVDRPAPQAWKRRRLEKLGFGVPSWLHLVAVDLNRESAWLDALLQAGFDPQKPALVAATGLSMYLRLESVIETLRQAASLPPGSSFAMSFMLPIELLAPELRPGIERAAEGARLGGSPFVSFFKPEELLKLSREAGFAEARHIPAASLARQYFSDRSDDLRPPENSEEFLLAQC